MINLEVVTKEDVTGICSKIDQLEAKFEQFKKLQSPKEYLTRKEVAEIWKVSVQTVINYQNRGIIQAYRIGRKIRYKREDVLKAPAAIEKSRYSHNT